jgi:uncharacterized integral membrane protein (TIGR00697 family)
MKNTLIAIYTAMLGIANIAAVKVVTIAGWEFTAGVVPIAIAYLVSDITVERYGKEAGHRLVWAGVKGLFAVISVTQAIVYLPGESAVNDVFAGSLPILTASITTIVVAQHSDVQLFTAIKDHLPYRPTRNIGSTVLSQLLDTTLFTLLAFNLLPLLLGGTRLPLVTLTTIIITEWIIKSGIAVLDTPIFMVATNDSD